MMAIYRSARIALGSVTLKGGSADDVITVGDNLSSGLKAEYCVQTPEPETLAAGTLRTERIDATINFNGTWDAVRYLHQAYRERTVCCPLDGLY